MTSTIKEKPSVRSDMASLGQFERKQRTAEKVWKVSVDTFAMVSFWTPVCIANDLLIGNMDIGQSLKARAIGAAVAVPTARPYGKVKDCFRKWTGTYDNSSMLRKVATDTTSLLVFSVPPNAALFFISGGEGEKFIPWMVGLSVITVTFGGAYGLFMDWLRKKAGTDSK